MTTQRGFTLLEALLSIAMISAIAAISIPVYQTFQVKNDTDIAASSVAQSLRRAQVLSQAVDDDTTWGVRIQAGSVVVFKGATYAGRDPDFDEVFDMPGTITPTGTNEVVFDLFTGEPQTTGTVTLTSSNGDVRTITINAKGMVEY